MKKTFILIMIIAISGLTYSQSWKIQNSNTNEDIHSIEFPSNCTGYAVGTGSLVLKTHTRGEIWFPMSLAKDVDIEDGFFLDENTGFIVGDDNITGSGFIYKTEDGAETWTLTNITFPDRINAVYFLNENTGWIVGRNEYIAKTTNGGLSWAVQPVNGGPGEDLSDVHFVNSNLGWAVGKNGTILFTVDGGTNWVAQNSGTGDDLLAIDLLNSTTGCAVGKNEVILKTTDAGNNWTVITPPGTGEDLEDVQYGNNSMIWAVGTAEVLLTSNDGGDTWVDQIIPTGDDLFSVYISDPQTAWVAGATGGVAHYRITDVPIAEFTTQSNVCIGSQNNFTDLSTNNPTSWSWNFGDGSSSSQQNPSHIYTQEGVYSVVLEVTNSTNCLTTFTMDVIVSGDVPAVAFSADPTEACGSALINFTDESLHFPVNWSWDFGDGNNDNVQNPQNFYNTPQTYDVQLTASNACGTSSSTMNAFITIYPNVVADAGVDVNILCTETATLTASATGGNGNYSYSWNNGVNNAVNPNLQAGTYTVTVTDGIGCTDTNTANVILTGTDLALNVTNTAEICFNTTTEIFANTTGGTGTYIYSWSNGANTQSIIVGGGIYDVTVTDGAGCSLTGQVEVIEYPELITYVGNDTTICQGLTVDIFSQTTGGDGNYNYIWSGGQNNANVTLSAGTHTLTVTDGIGCTASDDIIISESTPLTVNLGPDVMTCNVGITITANTTGGDNNISYMWSTGENTQSIFVGEGTYGVTAFDGTGCYADYDQIIVTQGPQMIPDFEPSTYQLVLSVSNTVDFFDLSTGAITWDWDFGNGNTSTNQNPSTVYTITGIYDVTLTTGNGVCLETVTKQIQVVQNAEIENSDFENLINIYPNPVTDNISIKVDESITDYQITVYDVTGNLIFEEKTAQSRINNIDFSDYNTGIYFIKFKQGNKLIIKKVVKL